MASKRSFALTSKNKPRKFRRSNLKWYVFMLPVLVAIVVFMAYPLLESFRMSFLKTNSVTESFRGLENYSIVLTDSLFWKSVWNTFYITFFSLVLVIPLALLLASVINEMGIGKNFAKGLYFVSYITPGIAACTVFLFVFHPQGIMNTLLAYFGIEPIQWLTYPISAQWSVIIYSVWKNVGFNMIIILAGLQAVPRELYEASAIDGCNILQSWRYITLPHMISTICLLFTMGWITGLQRFSDVFIFGNGSAGSPERSLFTMVSYIYSRGFGSFEFGVSSAASYIMFLIIFLFTIFNRKMSTKISNKFGEG